MRRLLRFVRAKLHRQLFLWFGATILLTGIVVMVSVGLVLRPGESWKRTRDRAQRFLGNRFAEVWSDPGQRDRLARRAAQELGADVTLLDAAGQTVLQLGKRCGRWRRWRSTVRRDGRTLGRVEICERHEHGHGGPLLFGLVLVVIGALLWGISGWVARRLGRPLRELAQVATRIGAGELGSRVKLSRHQVGEVGLLAASLNEMAARVEKQMADQRELLAAVSHEIRTPLGHMQILLELAEEDGEVSPAARERLAELAREVREIDALVGELLASSRLDFSAVSRRPVSVRPIAVRALERAGLAAELLIDELGDDGGDGVQADPTLLARAIANLLGNAEKHAVRPVALRVSRRDGALRIEVEDEGPGFPDGGITRAFDPFYFERREESATGNGDRKANANTRASLGLGLALVRRIARAHGGDAWAENTDRGARVGFSVATP